MLGPTHVLIGVSAAVASGRFFGNVLDVFMLLALILGSLAPDIDGDGTITKPGRIFQVFLGWRVAKAIDTLTQAVAAILKGIFGHRGAFHAPVVGGALCATAYYYENTFLLYFSLGYGLHLLADFFTKGGIPLLLPFSRKEFSGAPLRVGSKLELLVACLFLFFILFFGWELLPSEVKETHRRIYNLIVHGERW